MATATIKYDGTTWTVYSEARVININSVLPDGCYITSAIFQADVWLKYEKGYITIGFSAEDTGDIVYPGTKDAPYVFTKDITSFIAQKQFGSFDECVVYIRSFDRGSSSYLSNIVLTINYETFESTFTLPEGDIVAGQPITINITRSRPDTTCEVKAECYIEDESTSGGVLVHSISTGSISSDSATVSVTIPLWWARDITTSQICDIYFYIETTGYAQGDASQTTRTILSGRTSRTMILAESDVAPEITDASVEPNVNMLDDTNTFLQNYAVKTLLSDVSLKYNATLTRATLSINGTIYELPLELPSSNITTITSSGAKTFTITVYDSRGLTATWTKNINVLPYSPPKLVSYIVQRCDVDGSASDVGSYLSAYAVFTYSSFAYSDGAKSNSVTCNVAYKENGMGDSYIDGGTITESGSKILLQDTDGSPKEFGGEKACLVQITVADLLNSTTVDLLIESAAYTMHFKAGGKAVWLGKSSYDERDYSFGVDYKWASYFKGDVYFGNCLVSKELCVLIPYTATILGAAENWSEDAADGYTQDILISGLYAEDAPIIDIDLADKTKEQAVALANAMQSIYRAKTTHNKLTVYSTEPSLSADVPIKMLVVRKLENHPEVGSNG